MRLKAEHAVEEGFKACVEFQFQTGAIKRCASGAYKGFDRCVFQFQTGAIKRMAALLSQSLRVRFNSKLVRLKA